MAPGVAIHFDSIDYARMAARLRRTPIDIKARAFARVMARLRDMARTRVVKAASDWTDTPQKLIRPTTQARAIADAIDINMRTPWFALAKLGARQTARGVSVRGRGVLRGAFIARGRVLARAGAARYPIRELYGANPAHAIGAKPAYFEEVMAQLLETHLIPRVMHELDRLIAAA